MNSLPFTKETLCFQSAAGKLYHHSSGFVRLDWSAERTPLETMKAFYEQVLALLVSTGARKILSEHGRRPPLTGPAQQWLTENWIPRAMRQARAHHCAIVEGADPLHRLSTQTIVATAPTAFVFQRFSTLKEAQFWLTEV